MQYLLTGYHHHLDRQRCCSTTYLHLTEVSTASIYCNIENRLNSGGGIRTRRQPLNPFGGMLLEGWTECTRFPCIAEEDAPSKQSFRRRGRYRNLCRTCSVGSAEDQPQSTSASTRAETTGVRVMEERARRTRGRTKDACSCVLFFCTVSTGTSTPRERPPASEAGAR